MSESTQKIFDGIEHFIGESRALLKKGALLELDGLDAEVKTLCEQVVNLSDKERETYAPQLQKLFRDLEMLGQEMIAYREVMTREMQSMGQHQKATVAYRTADNIKKPDPEE